MYVDTMTLGADSLYDAELASAEATETLDAFDEFEVEPSFEYPLVDDNARSARNLFVAYLALIALEAAFIVGGIGHWRIAWLVTAAELALFLTCVPMVVTIVGMFRAVTAWEWPLWRAAMTFLGPFVVLAGAVGYREASLFT